MDGAGGHERAAGGEERADLFADCRKRAIRGGAAATAR